LGLPGWADCPVGAPGHPGRVALEAGRPEQSAARAPTVLEPAPDRMGTEIAARLLSGLLATMPPPAAVAVDQPALGHLRCRGRALHRLGPGRVRSPGRAANGLGRP